MNKKFTTPQKMPYCSTESNIQQQNKLVLSKGMEVEVTSNDEGFKGAWYTGTIINPPKKTRNKALVEYHNLVTEDGSKPLRELTNIAFIRPLPPPFDACNNIIRMFEENDVVDAFHNDGWWIGAVCRVLTGDRFLVYFDCPPDVIEFGVHDLRLHQDWIHGKWVQAKKQHKQRKSSFSPGQEVEVIFKEETTSDIWFSAIFIKEFEGSFLLKYKISRDHDEYGSQKVIVDSLRKIRPIPPPCVDRDYEVSEKVEVICEFCWRIGEITKVLADRRYEVFFELSQEFVQLDHTKFRPHMRWIAGKWISKSETVTSPKHTKERKGMPQSLKAKMPKALQSGKVVTRGAAVVALLCANEVATSELDLSMGLVPEAEEATHESEKVNTNYKKRRQRPSNSNTMSPVPLESGHSSKRAVKKRQTCCKAKDHKMAAAGSSNTPTDDNMPLCMLFGGVHSHAGIEMPRLLCYSKADQHREAPPESCSVKDTRDNVTNKNTSPPFVKRSPLWKTVESMKIFEMMPQKPHFLPLSKYKEDFREGNAIGMMVTFACIAEKVYNLKFDDPRSTFDNALENLQDLKNHGFDVDPLKNHVHELLSLKDRLSQLQEEARVAETRIKELMQDEVKFSNEVEDIELDTFVLQEVLLLVKSRVEKACHEIAGLRSGLKAINADIHDSMLEFDKLVVSPF